MHIVEETLDDLLRQVLRRLLKTKSTVEPTRGANSEITGVLLHLKNPLARISRTETKRQLFSALGEWCWYLAGSNSLPFISYYVSRYKEESEDGRTLYGAYGPRLSSFRRQDQIKNVLTLLRTRPHSRRAVIQLFDAADLRRHFREIPCTCTLQFLLREGRLDMITYMRSNDAFIGLPHDVFTFTMLQELLARSLRVGVGTYKHAVGSLHLYESNKAAARILVDEGWQQTTTMPGMPLGDPWPSLRKVLRAESVIRRGKKFDLTDNSLDTYWQDLVRLLQIYRRFKDGDSKGIAAIKKKMSSRIFDPYIEQKKASVAKRKDYLEQPGLFGQEADGR